MNQRVGEKDNQRYRLKEMGRPPRSVVLPLMNQPGQPGWVLRIGRFNEQLRAKQTDPETLARQIAWQAEEFVRSALRISGVSTQSGGVEESESPGFTQYLDSGRADLADATMNHDIACLRIVRNAVELEGRSARLSLALLSEVFESRDTKDKTKGKSPSKALSRGQFGIPPQLLLLSEWTNSEAFLELHAVEQSAIVLLRLIELVPVLGSKDRVSSRATREYASASLALASLPVLREKLPPLIIPGDLFSRFATARDEGLKMNTRPLVELLAASLEATLKTMIGLF